MLINRVSDNSRKYAFICYAHRDSDVVQQHAEWLSGHGFNLWYDDGLSAGTRWTDELAEAIAHADCVIFFVSEGSVESKYCLDEIQFAKESDIDILPVRLDSAELPPGLRLALGSIQIMDVGDSKAETRRRIATALTSIFLGQTTTAPNPAQSGWPKTDRIWLIRGLAVAIGLVSALIMLR